MSSVKEYHNSISEVCEGGIFWKRDESFLCDQVFLSKSSERK